MRELALKPVFDEVSTLAAWAEREYGTRPQKFVVLHRVITYDADLHRLRIGACEDVRFELEATDDASEFPAGSNHFPLRRTYALRLAGFEERLRQVGAAVCPHDEVAVPPAMDILVFLRNGTVRPVMPRAFLLVREEIA